MIYNLNEKFTKVEERKGVLENKSIHSAVELVVTDGIPEKDTGIELQAKEKMPFALEDGKSLYARCSDLNHMGANLAVANFNVPVSGGAGMGVLVPKMEKFEAAGAYEWNVPETGWYKVTVVGAGGSGGNASISTAIIGDQLRGFNVGGGGGAAGGTAIKTVHLLKGEVVAVIVGEGGKAVKGNAAANDSVIFIGNNGTSSSFGTHCSATGGSRAQSNLNMTYPRYGGNTTNLLTPGNGVNGDLNIRGKTGRVSPNCMSGLNGYLVCYGASGGDSSLGSTQPISYATPGDGRNGEMGSGGSGASIAGEYTEKLGGNGGDGIVIIEWTEVQ